VGIVVGEDGENANNPQEKYWNKIFAHFKGGEETKLVSPLLPIPALPGLETTGLHFAME